MKLTAYRVVPGMRLQLRPAERSRQWMDDTTQRFANRCLPLTMANQYGWEILCSHRIQATWNGNTATNGIHIEYLDGHGTPPASSHFGFGILTFSMPWLFRTPPGWNLLLRGPMNRPKAGIAPLDGLIEADWIDSTFTMNWKFTRTGTVQFDIDEPIGLLIPVQRDSLEAFEPEIRDIRSDPELAERFENWSKSRSTFIKDLREPGSQAQEERWQRDYTRSAEQTKLRLQPFVDLDPES